MKPMHNVFPFTAIVGQETMKLGLLLNLINPRLGGVLIRGEKGTAKSTAVRALADLMPGLNVVNLPVSATEDRVVGTLDIEHAIRQGEKRFEPGLLAAAHGHILYVDEINLLDDAIVDALLDAAAMGVNTVEREGVSHSHPAQFILIGTMNPEEGELRPQLLDRFALSVEVSGEKDVPSRMEVIRRRLAFESDPEPFRQRYGQDQMLLQERIVQAKELLRQIEPTEEMLEWTANIGIRLEVDGHRADITLMKTAMALAAYQGRTRVLPEDMTEAAMLVLPHRMRKRPFEDQIGGVEELRQQLGNLLTEGAHVT
ncbi:Magnesium-chelatase 38 kDa subunit [Paenibacillus solanacearum]|uniref:Magnesium-chelatase 38 kDa subunit n=1 Tax=Paenibacillus solanacearum TaxID=2048548 RepID=A0A916NRL1_9BACL|nr:AAA family ATPase [Paenibacillus solanacearum]CAG7648307.1 Magnesium-chelatase 38 kDa subunit [Paenibacillus solanacearum]